MRVRRDLPFWPLVLYSWKCDQRDHYCASEAFADKEDAIMNWNSLVETKKCIIFEDGNGSCCHDTDVTII